VRKNWKNISLCGLTFILFITGKNIFAMPTTISSPGGSLKVLFQVDSEGKPLYSIQLNDKDVLKPSSLGLIRDDQSFDKSLTLEKTSGIEKVEDAYTMLLGKKKNCSYQANRCTFTLKNSAGRIMQIIFQVSNDGVAFRYAFPEVSAKIVSITREQTSFAFAPNTVSWLHPMQPGKTGWCRTQPSYEEYYTIEQPVGAPSPEGEGWSFPALFKTIDNIWILICDSDVNESYCAVRLGHDSAGGVYKIAFPHPEEHRGKIDPVSPEITTPFASPWRVLIIGQKLNTLVESTLMTDIASPCKVQNTGFIKPGRAAWHWLRYGDNSATLQVAESFLDFAAKMKWEYILIDANWDKFIGYEKMADFVKKAASKNVSVILWYNSNGPWNDAPMGPKDKMHESAIRREEFAKLRDMGVRGVKIDFFGGDKQATMKLYLDILKDAADYGILVNCHGATIPRGWQRTYPNLVTMEAVRGMEYCTFEQANADRQPQHCCVLPFTRNVIGSMDFTPVVFNPRIRGVNLQTTLAFELALSVVFESGVQHFGLVPDEYSLMPDFVVGFLQNVPTVWEQTRLIDGYPGDFVVIARKSRDKWYIAGINGTDRKKELSLDLSFLPAETKATLITDGPERSFTRTALEKDAAHRPIVTLQPHGGFVIVTD
jgi:hypothetical protein